MRKIFKYEIPLAANTFGSFQLQIPGFPRLIHIAEQNGKGCMWFEVDPEKEPLTWHFLKLGTGHEVPSDLDHLGTYFQDQFVKHIYGR